MGLMEKPAKPADEESRLATLKSLAVLDTQPEERFDRLTRMCKRLFGVPTASLNLIRSGTIQLKHCSLSVTSSCMNASKREKLPKRNNGQPHRIEWDGRVAEGR